MGPLKCLSRKYVLVIYSAENKTQKINTKYSLYFFSYLKTTQGH